MRFWTWAVSILLAMVVTAMHVGRADDIKRAIPDDPSLPSQASYDFSVYYSINLNDQTAGASVVGNWSAIDCSGSWSVTTTTTVALTQSFTQGYLYDYGALQYKILSQQDGIRKTHTYACSAGTAVSTGGLQPSVPSSCDDETKQEGTPWVLLESVNFTGAALGLAADPIPLDVPPNLSMYNDFCIVFSASTSSSRVPFTGRLNLTVYDGDELIAWQTTWPNVVADNTPPRALREQGMPPVIGNTIRSSSTASAKLAFLPVYVTTGSLDVNGFNAVGDGTAQIWGYG